MFTKTMKFDDLDGNEVTQTFYFNYNKKEIAELLEFGYLLEFPPADPSRRLRLEEQLKRLKTSTKDSGLSEEENTKQAYSIFQDLVLDAYGEKAADNRGFNKNLELRTYLKNHNAFVEIVWEMLENPALGAQFIEACLPQKYVALAKEEMQKNNGNSLSADTLTEMVAEADRRQQDPATRVEPGVPEDADPAVLQLAQSVADEQPAVDVEDLSAEDILNMDEVAFRKIDPRRFNQEQMLAAFKRKSSV